MNKDQKVNQKGKNNNSVMLIYLVSSQQLKHVLSHLGGTWKMACTILPIKLSIVVTNKIIFHGSILKDLENEKNNITNI